MHTVYILLCADGSLYVGQTRNLRKRLEAHNAGRGSRHTRDRRPVHLAYAEHHKTADEATKRERQLKGWTLAKKRALIAGDAERLKRLARRRD